MAINVADGPLEPYGVGTLHFVIRGSFDDGTTWEASADYAPPP